MPGAAENETAVVTAHPAAAHDASEEMNRLRVERLQSMLLLREKQRLSMRLSFGIERLSRQLGVAFSQSVGLRFLAIRQRRRASVARLMTPIGTTGAD